MMLPDMVIMGSEKLIKLPDIVIMVYEKLIMPFVKLMMTPFMFHV